MKAFVVAAVLLIAGLGTGAGVLSAAGDGADAVRQRPYSGASGPASGTPSHQLVEKERARAANG